MQHGGQGSGVRCLHVSSESKSDLIEFQFILIHGQLLIEGFRSNPDSFFDTSGSFLIEDCKLFKNAFLLGPFARCNTCSLSSVVECLVASAFQNSQLPCKKQ